MHRNIRPAGLVGEYRDVVGPVQATFPDGG